MSEFGLRNCEDESIRQQIAEILRLLTQPSVESLVSLARTHEERQDGSRASPIIIKEEQSEVEETASKEDQSEEREDEVMPTQRRRMSVEDRSEEEEESENDSRPDKSDKDVPYYSSSEEDVWIDASE